MTPRTAEPRIGKHNAIVIDTAVQREVLTSGVAQFVLGFGLGVISSSRAIDEGNTHRFEVRKEIVRCPT